MQPCPKVGLDTGWLCNASCVMCFFRYNPNLHKNVHFPLENLLAKADKARKVGCNHAILIGHGEPMFYPHLLELLTELQKRGMAMSIITNGLVGWARYEELFDAGLDHVHLSVHGLGAMLDVVTQKSGAGRMQAECIERLYSSSLPFRTNTCLLQQNRRQIVEIIEHCVSSGAAQCALLNFLPHYEQHHHVTELAVHPGELKPIVAEAARCVLDAGRMLAIRYMPMCQVPVDLWPYVTNAAYTQYDPFEWRYFLDSSDADYLWKNAAAMGESVAVQGEPCRSCAARKHCGGWNRTYAAAFPGCIEAIREVPDQYADVWNRLGGLFDLNPANHHSGTLRKQQ